MENKVYIVDLYNKFSLDDAVFIFKLNGRWWAIKRVALKWGKPQLSSLEDNENPYLQFRLYNTFEEALHFVRQLKLCQ